MRKAKSFPPAAIEHFREIKPAGFDNFGAFLESNRSKSLKNRHRATGSGDKAAGGWGKEADRRHLAIVRGQKATARGDKPNGRWHLAVGSAVTAPGCFNLATGRTDFSTASAVTATGRRHPATGNFNPAAGGKVILVGRSFRGRGCGGGRAEEIFAKKCGTGRDGGFRSYSHSPLDLWRGAVLTVRD